MAVEARRGCGYRKVGGLYLVSGGAGVPCDRLPIRLDVCPVCSHGFKQSRGWTWVDLFGLLGGDHTPCECRPIHDTVAGILGPCPLCQNVKQIGKAGLLWIGEKFYKRPADFVSEGIAMGLSRRISAIPRNFKVGETWVLLAHPKAIGEPGTEPCDVCGGGGELEEETEEHTPTDRGDEVRTVLSERQCDVCKGKGQRDVTVWVPGIFTLWKPSRIEKICKESERESEAIAKLIEQGMTPVFVPDDDPDHQGSVYDKDAEEEAETSNNHVAA